MPQIEVFSTSGKKLTPVTASAKIFSAKANETLVAQAVRVYLSNQRAATAKAQRRGDVNVTHAKVWKQKGTGRARHGSRNAPIFVGGAVAHGPTGGQNYALKMGKTMKQKSLFSVLSAKLKAKEVLVIDGLVKLTPKTKAFDKAFRSIEANPRKITLLLDKVDVKIKRGVANLSYLNLSLATDLNTYQALNSRKIIFTKDSLKVLEKHYVN